MTKNDTENINSPTPLFVDALSYLISSGQASIAMLQRKYALGYADAGRLIDQIERLGYISGFNGSKARQVFITKEQFDEKYGDFAGTYKPPETRKTVEAPDPLLADALEYIISIGKASIVILQKHFGISYMRAGQIIEQMENANYISGFEGSSPRRVLIGKEQFDKQFGK